MRILFDIWILDQQGINKMSFEEEQFLETIFDFVDGRLKILEEEIDAEEANDPEENCVTIIEIIKQRVSYHGYSESLIEKMKLCFNERDGIILGERLDKAFSYLN